jgi:hypothetical protein
LLSFRKFLKIKVFDSATRRFFIDLVSANIKYREANNIRLNDVMNLLAKRDGEIALENDEQFENAGFATAFESNNLKADSTKAFSE